MSYRNRIAAKNGYLRAIPVVGAAVVPVVVPLALSLFCSPIVAFAQDTPIKQDLSEGASALVLQPFPNDYANRALPQASDERAGTADALGGTSAVQEPHSASVNEPSTPAHDGATPAHDGSTSARDRSAPARVSPLVPAQASAFTRPSAFAPRIAQASALQPSLYGSSFRTSLPYRSVSTNHDAPARGNIFTRFFSPLIDPISGGLNTTSTSLEQTAAGINGLASPITNLAQPLTGLQQPISGLQQPLMELRQPIIDLGQPIQGLQQPIQQLGDPVRSLSRSAASLSTPMSHLSSDLERLRQPLSSVAQPLSEIRQPLRGLVEPMRALPGPLNGLVAPMNGLQSNLAGMQQPLRGVSTSLSQLQQEVSSLRTQIEKVYDAIVDIGRNVTLAIVFGSSVIAYAIWTHRKVPSVVEPTIATIETMLAGQGSAVVAPSDHTRTIIKTEPVSHASAHTPGDTATWNETHPAQAQQPMGKPPQGSQSSGRSDDQPPPPPPPTAFTPPGE